MAVPLDNSPRPLSTKAGLSPRGSALRQPGAAGLRLHGDSSTTADPQDLLEEARDRYRELFEVAPSPYFMLDRHGLILEVNRAALTWMNAEPTRAVDRPFVFLVAPEDRRKWLDLLSQTLLTGRRHFQGELNMAPVVNQIVRMRLEARELFNTSRPCFAVVLLPLPEPDAVDYSVLEQIQRKVQEQTDQLVAENRALQRADERKNEFLAVLGHELRNPLAALANGLSVLSLMGGLNERQTEVVDLMQRQIGKMTRLTSDVNDVSRLTFGKLSLEKRPGDLRDIVRGAVETCRPAVELRRHRLSVQLVEQPCPVWGDAARLEQVIVNLLHNAAKYTQPGGQLRLAVRRDQQLLEVEVADNGAGMSAETLATAFDLFRQADASGRNSQGGLGIGLALVKALVDLHGGSVAAHSAGLGQGTTVWVRLPVADTETLAGGAPPLTEPPVTPNAKLRIVIVEDNADAAGALQLLLKLWGHEVEVAQDGVDGRDLILKTEPRLAIVDLDLPRLSGYELARQVRRRLGADCLRLVALSGYQYEIEDRRIAEAGFDRHLTKPLLAQQLWELLRLVGEK